MATKRDFATAASGDAGTSASSSAAAGVSTSQLDEDTSRRRRIYPTLNPAQSIIELQKKLLPLKWSKLKNFSYILHESIVNTVRNLADQEGHHLNGPRVKKLIERICRNIKRTLRTIKKIIEACSIVPEQRLNLLVGISEKPNFGKPMAIGQLMGSFLEEPGRRHHLKPCPEGMAVKLVRECGFDINVTADDLLNEFFNEYMKESSPGVKEGIRRLVVDYQLQHGFPLNVEEVSTVDLEGAAGYAAGGDAAAAGGGGGGAAAGGGGAAAGGGGRMQGGRRTRRKNKRSKKNKKSKKIKRKSIIKSKRNRTRENSRSKRNKN